MKDNVRIFDLAPRDLKSAHVLCLSGLLKIMAHFRRLVIHLNPLACPCNDIKLQNIFLPNVSYLLKWYSVVMLITLSMGAILVRGRGFAAWQLRQKPEKIATGGPCRPLDGSGIVAVFGGGGGWC